MSIPPAPAPDGDREPRSPAGAAAVAGLVVIGLLAVGLLQLRVAGGRGLLPLAVGGLIVLAIAAVRLVLFARRARGD